LGKPLKFLRKKLKILELHRNKFKTPQILKQYPPHYFPPCETSKMARRKLKTSNFQNIKTKDLPSFQKKNKYFHPCETSHKIIKDSQNDEKKIEDFKFSK
jgi:hypothetical protein